MSNAQERTYRALIQHVCKYKTVSIRGLERAIRAVDGLMSLGPGYTVDAWFKNLVRGEGYVFVPSRNAFRRSTERESATRLADSFD